MGKFRKKPVVIEAVRYTGSGDLPAIWELAPGKPLQSGPDGSLVIPTLEGDMRANFGDWIIRGIKGGIYPCKNDVFDATYEPAEE